MALGRIASVKVNHPVCTKTFKPAEVLHLELYRRNTVVVTVMPYRFVKDLNTATA